MQGSLVCLFCRASLNFMHIGSPNLPSLLVTEAAITQHLISPQNKRAKKPDMRIGVTILN